MDPALTGIGANVFLRTRTTPDFRNALGMSDAAFGGMGKQPANALQTVARSGGRAVVALSLVCYATIYVVVGLIILFCLRGLIVIFGDRKEPSSA